MRGVPLVTAMAIALAGCAVAGAPSQGESSTTAPPSTLPPTTANSPATTLPPVQTTTSTTQLEYHRVTGVVVDAVGRPVIGAEVRFGEETLLSGTSGVFAIEAISTGEITVSKRGWTGASVEWSGDEDRVEITLHPIVVRGLRVSGEAAGDDDAFARLLALARESVVNALVFDTKKEGGTVLYDTDVEEAHVIGAVQAVYDPRARVAAAHDEGLYVITRVVTFEDGYWARGRPEDRLAGGWVDPTAANARAYNIALAREACEMGFDEVQFDYIRYPAGKTADISGQRGLTEEFRVNAIVSFLAEARAALEPMGCHISAAVFGIVVSTEVDHSLGQRPEEMSPELHALSPMIYPSHYADGWRGFDNPNDFPYEVVVGAIEDALPRLEPGTMLRPWLQAFWWTNSQIRESIMAAEERGVGWMLWNWGSNFDLQALPTDEEVNG